MSAQRTSAVQSVPASRFYWALLEPGRLRGRRRERLGYLFESYLPVPIEEVCATYVRLRSASGEPRYVACGLGRADLEALTDAGSTALVPDGLPEAMGDAVSSDALNLLTGAHTPKRVLALRRSFAAIAIGSLVVSAFALTVGLVRRAAALERQATEITARANELCEQALGADARSGSLPPERKLVAELRRLEQTRSAVPNALVVEDAATTLADLLGQWPSDLHARTHSLTVTPSTITTRASVPRMADAQELSSALARLPGWLADQPQSEAREGAAEVSITMRRASGEGGA